MTNREYLATLSNQKLAEIIINELPIIGKSYNNSILGLAEWLGQERSIPSTKPKQATWVLSADGFHCSRCGYKDQSTGFPGTCPNCNSKMGGIDERRSTSGCNY